MIRFLCVLGGWGLFEAYLSLKELEEGGKKVLNSKCMCIYYRLCCSKPFTFLIVWMFWKFHVFLVSENPVKTVPKKSIYITVGVCVCVCVCVWLAGFQHSGHSVCVCVCAFYRS